MPKYDLWGHAGIDVEIPEDDFPDEDWRKEKDELFDDPEHGYFESTYEGKKLHYRANFPKKKDGGGKDDDAVRAVVVYQHGIHSQSGYGIQVPSDGRYTDHALRSREFTAKGYALYAHDQLGHGYSEGTRFYIPDGDWTINRDDMIKFVKLVASKHPPGTPLFVMGESYGGCIAFHASHALWNDPEKPEGFMGSVLDYPALHGDIPPWPIKAFLMYVLKPLAPTWTPFFMPNAVTPERIWKDPEVRAVMTEKGRDKCLSKSGEAFSLGTATGLVRALEASQTLMPTFFVPFHINHGTDDFGVPISGSQELMEKSQTPEADKELNVVEGGYHALFGELEAATTMKHEIDWIEKRIGA